MADSIIQEDKKCFICGTTNNIQCHHIFGASSRSYSEKYGLKVYLCREHHTGNNGVHFQPKLAQMLHEIGQKKGMEHYGWSEDEFRRIFGRNYL